MQTLQWIYCPVCGNKTRLQTRADTELKNFPLFCPKCKQEIFTLITFIHVFLATGNTSIL